MSGVKIPSSQESASQRDIPPWELNSSRSDDLEAKLTNFWKTKKWWILASILIIQLLILGWANRTINHPAIPPNEEGRKQYASEQFPISESKFIESASFGFRREKPLLNLGLNYSQIKDFEESHRILENVMQSNRFFWEAYAADGFVLFEWGKKELDNPECDIRQTEVLWVISKKRFRYASLIAFFQIVSIPEGMKLRESYREMEHFIQALPEWREVCLNPPPEGGGGGDSDSDSDSDPDNDPKSGGSDPDDDNENSGDPSGNPPPDGTNPSDGKPDPGDKSPDSGSPDQGKPEPSKSELEKKREEQAKNRESKMQDLEINPDEKGDLEAARKRMEGGSNFEDYVRHKEEINLVTSPTELEKAMKNAEW